MMLPSHLLATLLALALVSLVRPLAPREWLLALAFGVAIDLDHLLQMPRYVAANGGLAALTPAAIPGMLQWGAAWQGFMHTPWALLVVLPACLLFASPTPLLFWGLHMVQDFVIATRFVRFGSAFEWAIVGALFAALVATLALERRLHAPDAPFLRHALARVGIVLT